MKLLQELNEMANHPKFLYGTCTDCGEDMGVPFHIFSKVPFNLHYGDEGLPNVECPDCGAMGTFNPEHPDDAADRYHAQNGEGI